MLCPEVWHFKAPRHHFECHDTLGQEAEAETKSRNRLTNTIKAHYFNHSVSVVLPNTNGIPERFNESVLEDSDYYRIDGLRAVELVDKEFIESFVKKGELSLLAVERRIDVDNSAAISPSGHLLLSLSRDRYQRLGIEGRPTAFERRAHSRYGK
ncbi:ribonuclease P protein subunit p40-like [Phymastichus coffea]|uniref:ribonuclease P protein subunit p40-like n=1 Tax=Phymastichus coffea TaxID=108790 RepID=UPI00273B13AE|nr:ribonuclease P protein subunit p40-like [Phymastichus coffea]